MFDEVEIKDVLIIPPLPSFAPMLAVSAALHNHLMIIIMIIMVTS